MRGLESFTIRIKREQPVRRRRPSSNPAQPYAGINLVPLVDLALNLVLIMIIMAPTMQLARLPVELPAAKSADVDKYDTLRLNLADDGRLSIDGDMVNSWEELPQELKTRMQKFHRDKILLEVDRRVPFRETSRLLNLLRHRTPITNISIGTVPQK